MLYVVYRHGCNPMFVTTEVEYHALLDGGWFKTPDLAEAAFNSASTDEAQPTAKAKRKSKNGL